MGVKYWNGTEFVIPKQKIWDGTQWADVGGGEYGTAIAADVLAPKTIATESGLIPGTMVNKGAVNIIPSLSQQSIAAGFHNGSGIVEPIPILPGNSQIYLNATENYYRYAAATKVREVRTAQKATYRVKFDMWAQSGGDIRGQIYKNGVAYGTLRSTTSTTAVTFTEDLVFQANDLIELYVYSIDSTYANNIKNFGLYVYTPAPTITVLMS